jgi:glutathione reductase (NADPH)
MKEYAHAGITIHTNSKEFSKIEKLDSGALRIHYPSPQGPTTMEVDCVIFAIGRVPHTDRIGLETLGVKTDHRGDVAVDAYQNSNVPGVYAIGDVIGKWELTPGTLLSGRGG